MTSTTIQRRESVRTFDERLSLRQHVYRLLEDIHKICRDSPAYSLQLDDLVEALSELEIQLAEYFREEERLTDLPTMDAWLDAQISSQQSEHSLLIKDLRRTSIQAANLLFWGQTQRELPALAEQFVKFHERLLDHEQRDDEVIFKAYFEDVGLSG